MRARTFPWRSGQGCYPEPRLRIVILAAQTLELTSIAAPEVESKNKLHSITSAEDWWTIVRGSGYRGTIEQLSATDYDTVRQINLAELGKRDCREVQTNALFAVAIKPGK